VILLMLVRGVVLFLRGVLTLVLDGRQLFDLLLRGLYISLIYVSIVKMF